MQDFTWSPKEKQVARSVFEHAALAEETELLNRFKAEAAELKTLEELWGLQYAIREAERAYQQKFDYRYSQLIIVFGRLLREKRITLEDLRGLKEDKIEYIKGVASL
jgi:steroid 5-alpha reductase family enzyme